MLHEINSDAFNCNPFNLIGKEWMLITAGTENNFNTMTASWGGLGFIWGYKAATVYIRPQRYTKEFVDKTGFFTLSFFDGKYKDTLNFCGSHSGRDVNKIKTTGLTPARFGEGIAFSESKLVIVCEKVFAQEFKRECFLDKKTADKWYQDDFHTMYIGKILKVYQNAP